MKPPRILSAWEKAVDAFAYSSWSSLALLLFGAAWIAAEWARGKGIGWDGVLTLVAVEIALGTRRWQGRNR